MSQPTATPPDAVAPAGYDDLAGYLRSWLDYRRWLLRIPGVQAAVRHRDELVVSVASGLADEPAGVALTTRHLFRVASHSKSFTAVAVLQLVQRGDLRLDDTLGELVAGLAGSPLAARTVRELLSHGGGVVRDSEDGDFWALQRPFPDQEQLLGIARATGSDVIARNEHFKYSNIGYGLLGLVIAAVTGRDVREHLRAAVVAPLGLHDTSPDYDSDRAEDYAAAHTGLATARQRRVVGHVDTGALSTATGFSTTAEDLTAFFAALLPDDDRLLGADAQRLLRHPQWQVKEGERAYGLGVFLDRVAEHDLFGHTGGYPGHATATVADAETGWVVSALTNAVDGDAWSLAVGWFRLLALGEAATHAKRDGRADRLTGRFASLWGPLDVVALDGRLFAIDPTAPDPAEDAVPLEVVDDTTLKVVGGRGGNSYGECFRYDVGDDGVVRSMRGNSAVTMYPFDLARDG